MRCWVYCCIQRRIFPVWSVTPLPDRYVQVINEQHPINEHLKQIDDVGHHMKIQHSSMHLAFGAPVVRIREMDQERDDHAADTVLLLSSPWESKAAGYQAGDFLLSGDCQVRASNS